MKILVFGANGFLGRWVCVNALNAGHEVFAVSRSPDKHLEMIHDRFLPIYLPTTDWHLAISQKRPDVVIHCDWEGVSSQSRDLPEQQNNISRWLSLAHYEISFGVSKTIYLGSQAEFGSVLGHISEGDHANPDTQYGIAKEFLRGELSRMFSNSTTQFVWARLFSFYGAMDYGTWLVPMAIRNLMLGNPLNLSSGLQRWNYLHVSDVASALVRLVDVELKFEEFNIANPKSQSVREIAEEIGLLLNSKLLLNFDKDELNFIPDVIPTSSRIQELDWSPYFSIEEGLSKTVLWFRGDTQYFSDYNLNEMPFKLPIFSLK